MSKKGRHKSLEKGMRLSIRWIEGIPCIKKVVLGISESCRHKYAPGTLRFKSDVEGGIKINAYSGMGVTDIFIKIDPLAERERIKQLIAERFMQG